MFSKKMIFAILSAALCFAVCGCSVNGSSDSSTAKKTTTQKVTRGDLVIGLVADGKINLSLTDLNFEVSGIVKTIKVKEGDTVKKGDVLATLDDTDYKQAVTTAKNALDQAEQAYSAAVDDHKLNVLNEKLQLMEATNAYNAKPSDSTLKTKLEIEKLKYSNLVNNDSTVTGAKLKVASAKSDLSAAKENLNKVVMKAPGDGIINSISYKVGELVSSSDTGVQVGSSGDSAFMVLCDPSVINLTASVTEGDISGLKSGQVLSVSIDALGLDGLSGKVTQVSNTAKTDTSGIVSYTVTGQLDKPNSQIMDSMTCTVTFIKKQLKNVLQVPVRAVYTENGQQYVNVLGSDGKTVKTAVTCGLSNGSQTEVTKGLTEGETVVINSIGSVTQS